MSYMRIGWPRRYADGEKTEQYVIDTGEGIKFYGLGSVDYHDWAEIVVAAVRRTGLDDDVVAEVEEAVVDEFVDDDVAVIRDQDELNEVYLEGAEELAEKGRKFVEELDAENEGDDADV